MYRTKEYVERRSSTLRHLQSTTHPFCQKLTSGVPSFYEWCVSHISALAANSSKPLIILEYVSVTLRSVDTGSSETVRWLTVAGFRTSFGDWMVLLYKDTWFQLVRFSCSQSPLHLLLPVPSIFRYYRMSPGTIGSTTAYISPLLWRPLSINTDLSIPFSYITVLNVHFLKV
jgi:hypothetical protein